MNNNKLKYKVSLILKDRFDEGYRIVIFTNQNGIAKGHTDENNIQKKIQDIASAIGIKMTALMASHEDENRKPTLGTNYSCNFLRNVETFH